MQRDVHYSQTRVGVGNSNANIHAVCVGECEHISACCDWLRSWSEFVVVDPRGW
jgi:hypothetical protein